MTKGVWREAADSNPSRLGLGLALLAAAMLRFWALAQGIPFSLGVDEPEVMERAVRMMKTGDFNPHFFDYPSLYMYVQALVAVFRFAIGAMGGMWNGLAQAPTQEFYVWGRAVTAIFGTATVWIVYCAGMRWGGRTALLAAALLAVMPMHVRESHYVLTDVPATFLVMLTLLLSLRAHERSTGWSFALAGAVAGLAGATKYNGVLAVLMPIIACLMTPATRPSRPAAMLWIISAMLAAFFLAAPYTFLDLPTFLNQFARLSSEFRAPSVTPEPIWLIYLKHLRNAFTPQYFQATGFLWPGTLIVIAGFALGAWRTFTGPERLKWMLVVIFPLVHFKFISSQNIFFGRYLLPLIPFLSILGAAAVVWCMNWMRQRELRRPVRNLITIALTLAAIVPPAYSAIQYNANAAKVWTPQLAYEYVVRVIPAGARIRTETRAFLLPPRYRVSHVKQLRLTERDGVDFDDIDYLVASSQNYGTYFDDPGAYPVEYAAYQRIFEQTEEIARFTPSREHPGPILRILRVKR